MPIGNRDSVRNLSGLKDLNELTNAEVDEGLRYGRGELYANTFKADWDTDTNHILYNKAETLVHYCASFYCLDRYSGNQVKANQHRERAKELAAELKMQYDQFVLVNSGSGSNQEGKFNVVASKYKTWPLNPDATIPRSQIIIPGD